MTTKKDGERAPLLPQDQRRKTSNGKPHPEMTDLALVVPIWARKNPLRGLKRKDTNEGSDRQGKKTIQVSTSDQRQLRRKSLSRKKKKRRRLQSKPQQAHQSSEEAVPRLSPLKRQV